MSVLVLAAHPDDEVLGCGGTIAKLAEQGQSIYIAILGEGITSRYDRRKDAEEAAVEQLRACSRAAAELLGAKDLFTHDLPDNRFDTVPLLDIVKLVESLIERVRPDVVFAHHAGDLNVDHSLLGRAVATATRPVPGSEVKEVYAFETPSSTEWTFHQIEPMFRANTFHDISRQIDKKVTALSAYEGEVRPYPHPRSPEVIRAIARRWGSVVGCEAAEAFELIRAVR